MRAMIVKEFRQLRRDRRTLAMMILMPVLLLVVLGYAASFDVSSVAAVVAGPRAHSAAPPKPFAVVARDAAGGQDWARNQLRDGHAAVAFVTGDGATPEVLIDGSQLFTAQAAERALAGTGDTAAVHATVLYNPGLKTSDIMIPGLTGVILAFIGTVITSLGVVRERESGTLEQLAVMPLKPADVFVGKLVPYFVVALADLALVLIVGITLFGVPFVGSPLVFGLGALLFVFTTLGIGVLISSVSQNQGQAIQLAIMILLPQILLSGLIFPLSSMVAGVRWIAYILPISYFIDIARGVMLKGEPITALWAPFTFLTVIGAAVVLLATLRFRALLAPHAGRAA
ncbi:MAG: ABC transporter permease [Streptosporangiaceae bacterium]|jgi:ABC-2 type transport system permease protein